MVFHFFSNFAQIEYYFLPVSDHLDVKTFPLMVKEYGCLYATYERSVAIRPKKILILVVVRLKKKSKYV